MYIPRRFAETRSEILWKIFDENNFGTLISVVEERPRLSHLPFLREGNKLVAHMARENDHWRIFEKNPCTVVEFLGPHAYISPAWYPPSPRNVPTWNYVTVHVHGRARILTDADEAFRTLENLVAHHEQKYATHWPLDPAGSKHLLAGIVAFEITVEHLEGKLKLSQHQPPSTRTNVAHALLATEDTTRRALGRWMLETEPTSPA